MKKAILICSLGILVVFALSCGHPMTLESITVSPSTQEVDGFGATPPVAQVQYIAYGHFIHPVKMVDITNQVTWTSLYPGIATVETGKDPNPGLVTTTGQGCGTLTITATAGKGVVGPGDANEIVTGTATFIVTAKNAPVCGGTTPAISVAVAGTGSGTINGSGIACTDTAGALTGVCSETFASGSTTQVTLVATPTGGSTFGTWTGCTSTSATTCSVSVSSSTTVTATFLPAS